MSAIAKRLSTDGSLQRKFCLALLVSIVLVFPPIMIAVDLVAQRSIHQEMQVRQTSALKMHAAAVAKPLYDFDYANLTRMAAVIATSEDVDGVAVQDAEGRIVAVSPGFDPARAKDRGASIAIAGEIDGQPRRIGALSLFFNTERAQAAMEDFYWRTGTVITLSLAVVFVTLLITLRRVMLRPLAALMKAIEGSQAGGPRQLAQWRSQDEMGRLVRHFNAMQTKLSEEEAKLKAAYERLSTLYNRTPAMLFSLDEAGRIADVSDYWVSETGYARDQVVGRRFAEFLEAPRCVEPAGALDAAPFERWQGRFLKADGEAIDIYVSESKEPLDLDSGARALLVMVDISRLKQAEAELLVHARTDSLTGLPNRRHFKERLAEVIAVAESERSAIAVCFIDLDRFKWVNDNLGHHAGDEILNASAERIRSVLPEDAFFSRLGGDEFALFLRGEGAASAAEVSSRINEALAKPFSICGSQVTISASIGIACFPDNAKTVGELLRAADLAMYRTKRAGRRGFSKYDASIGDEARRLFEVEELLKTGFAQDRFYLDYQPIVRLSDERTIGGEALLRMRDARKKIVPPGDFIALAEECGMMPELGGFALRRGIAEFAQIMEKLGWPEAARLSINLSAVQVTEDLPEEVQGVLEQSGFEADRLLLEITESVFLKNNASLLKIFERIRALGCRLALDDFGTGYSSLSYLNDFPVDVVKIDRQFIRRLDGDDGRDHDPELKRRARALLQGVAAIARELRFDTVAEGVETQAQRRLVRELGFEYGQGFLWSKPIELKRFEARMRSERAALAARSG